MTIKVGIAGIGFMGWIHWLAYKQVEGIEVVAVAEQDATRRTGDWRTIKGNFGPPGEQVDLSGIAVYADYIDMLDDPNIDMVDICLPPAAHVTTAVAAANKGKHVFCEKPIALNVPDAEAMVAACQANNRLIAVGHVLPFFPEYQWALGHIRSGEFGQLLGGSFKRVISDPNWLPDFYNLERVGGPLLDLHIHDAHLIRLLFGLPTQVTSRGRLREGTVAYAQSLFDFEDLNLVVSSTMGVINQQGRPFTHGFEIHLERATIHFEFAAFEDGGETMPVKLVASDGTIRRPLASEGDPIEGFVAEIEEVKKAVLTGHPSPILGGDLARDAIKICAAEAMAVATRKAISV